MLRPQSAVLPREFQFWPEDTDVDADELEGLYSSGYAGAWKDDEAVAEFEALIVGSGGDLDGQHVAQENGLIGSGAGRLVIPFVFVEQLLPGCLPGAAQQRGDCVAHSTKNAALTTMVCDIVSGKPDEVTGKVEGLPEIDPVGIRQGALSTEAIYWYRGYSGDGWSCEAAANVAIKKAALWPRRNYPDLGVDLTKYSGGLAGKYGRSAPPNSFTVVGQQNLIRTATRLNSKDMVRDFLANGYGITTCGGEGWAKTRDENGFSRRSGSWAHAMAYIGYDDRPLIIQKYGEPLVLVMNSWGRWNGGGRRILGTTIDIPEGSFWAKWSDCSRRTALAFSGANGWPAKKLPPFQLVVG